MCSIGKKNVLNLVIFVLQKLLNVIGSLVQRFIHGFLENDVLITPIHNHACLLSTTWK